MDKDNSNTCNWRLGDNDVDKIPWINHQPGLMMVNDA